MSTTSKKQQILSFGIGCMFALAATYALAQVTPKSSPSDSAAEAQPNGRNARSETTSRPRGLSHRVPWTTSRITGSLEPPAPYRTERAFDHLKLDSPVVLTDAPGTDLMFVAQLDGKIYSFENRSDVKELNLMVDVDDLVGSGSAPEVNDSRRRIYGLTFHPQFETNRKCYLCYICGNEIPDGTRVSELTCTTTDPPRVELDSEKILITWLSGGHNGGCLKFGPDGYLYITTGDGGPAFPPDPLGSGQDVSNLLSSVLRIDVDDPPQGKPYRIPDDNPFVSLDDARGEVWAYGFRNPWKISFDPLSGDLWLGDVGWELWEMVYRVERGGNYGWSLMEGRQPVHQERTRGPTEILPPTIEHSHIESRSITGGHVYRGKRLADLYGAYIYGDYVTGKIWAARFTNQRVTSVTELVDSPLQVICFGTDRDGELYVVGYDGTIHQLVPNKAVNANEDFPRRLSDTGLLESVENYSLAAGVLPYSINAEPWQDGARADRLLAVPGTKTIGVFAENNPQVGKLRGAWDFPSDTVLAKTLSLDVMIGNETRRHRLETQILHYDKDTWRAYTYVWNSDQTDAELADAAGMDLPLTIPDPLRPGGQRQYTWHVAGRSECMLCHSTRGGVIYGFIPGQLDKLHDYNGVVDHQLSALNHIGLFEEPLPERIATFPDPFDPDVELESRARAYLHVNCAHCHRRGGGGTSAIELVFEHSINKTNLLNARPTQGTFGIHGAQVLVPGNPLRSVLYYRMAKTGRGRMPYFGSSEVDRRGLKLIYDWIQGMDTGTSQADRFSQSIKKFQQSVEQRDEILDTFLASTSQALAFTRAVDDGQLSPTLAERIIRAGVSHDDVRIRDLFERYVSEQERTRRLGNLINPDSLLAMKGQAARGRDVFFNTEGVQCKTCHRIGDSGRILGPDLTQIGKKYNRAQLLESILEPSKTIDPKFVTQLIETVDGRVLTGLLSNQSKESLTLKTAQNEEVVISRGDIEFMTAQQKSLMPDLLLRDMTAQQVADLLEYLSSLK